MDARELTSEIRRRLEAAGTRERREVATTYFPTTMEVLGVAVPDLRVIVRDISKRVKGSPPGDVLCLADELLADGAFEGRQVAYEILSRHRPALASLRTDDVQRLGKGIDNWASVDTFATLIAGPTWREGRTTDAAIDRWARSRDRWWRRAAIVCTVALNQRSRGGKGDTPRTLRICEIVAEDRDDMVAKGLSWALRTLSVRDRQATLDFLALHEIVLPARVLREVGNKLTTGLKNPGQRG